MSPTPNPPTPHARDIGMRAFAMSHREWNTPAQRVRRTSESRLAGTAEYSDTLDSDTNSISRDDDHQCTRERTLDDSMEPDQDTWSEPPAYSPLDSFAYADGVHIDLPTDVMTTMLESGTLPPHRSHPSMSRRRLGTPLLALAHQVLEGASRLRTHHLTPRWQGTIYHLLNHQRGCGGSKPARTAARPGNITLPPTTADPPSSSTPFTCAWTYTYVLLLAGNHTTTRSSPASRSSSLPPALLLMPAPTLVDSVYFRVCYPCSS